MKALTQSVEEHEAEDEKVIELDVIVRELMHSVCPKNVDAAAWFVAKCCSEKYGMEPIDYFAAGQSLLYFKKLYLGSPHCRCLIIL